MGFGHRVYKNYDPRATVMQKTVREVFDALKVNDPLFDTALRLVEPFLFRAAQWTRPCSVALKTAGWAGNLSAGQPSCSAAHVQPNSWGQPASFKPADLSLNQRTSRYQHKQ